MDLRTDYLGMQLKNPLVASASPLSRTLDGIRRIRDAGAGAVVIQSLFEEQITLEGQQLDHYLGYGGNSFAEALSYLPEMEDYRIGPEEYLKLIRDAKKEVDIPVIASLNGASAGGWTRYALMMEEAGADALELNVYFVATDPDRSGAEVEQRYLDVLKRVKERLRIPVAVKTGPYFSSMAHMAKRFCDAGAAGLVLFNRFYQPDIDLDNLEVVPNLVLSGPYAMRAPLRWTAILYGKVPADIAVSGGVGSEKDVLKAVMAGASAVQTASELLRGGLGRVREILSGVEKWMQEHEYESIRQMKGSMSQKHIADPSSFERANYMKVLQSFRPDPTGRLT